MSSKKKSKSKKTRIKGWNISPEKRSELFSGDNNGFAGKSHTNEARQRIGAAKQLDEETRNERIQDFESIEKMRGFISKLSNKWGVSHTQVRNFLKQNGLD